MPLQRDARRAGRVVRCAPAGLESLLGHARLLCHRWSTASKRAGFSCTLTCTTIHELLTALDARVVPQRRWRCSAKLDDQQGCCAACQLVWSGRRAAAGGGQSPGSHTLSSSHWGTEATRPWASWTRTSRSGSRAAPAALAYSAAGGASWATRRWKRPGYKRRNSAIKSLFFVA